MTQTPVHRRVLNPDDPDGDYPEVAAWFNPMDIPGMGSLRPECMGTPWMLLRPREPDVDGPVHLDEVGHEFHGNQYTGGIGGAAAGSAGDPKGESYWDPDDVRGVAAMSVPAEKLKRLVWQAGELLPVRKPVKLAWAPAEVRLAWAPAEEIELGDDVGHDFHGNQWTGGIGGGSMPPTKASGGGRRHRQADGTIIEVPPASKPEVPVTASETTPRRRAPRHTPKP